MGAVGVVHGRVMCLMGCVSFTAAHFQLPPRLGGSMPVRKLIEASAAADSAGFHAPSGGTDIGIQLNTWGVDGIDGHGMNWIIATICKIVSPHVFEGFDLADPCSHFNQSLSH